MKAKFNTRRLEKGFFKSSEFKNLERIGAAAFEPRMSGGFAKLIDERQGEWAPLSEQYKRDKARRGQSTKKMERTGRMRTALSQGRPPKQGTRKRVKFRIGRNLLAYVRFRGFKPNKGKYPAKDQQEKIAKNLEYGIDSGGRARLKDRAGRRLSGRQGRPLFRWRREEIPAVEAAVAREASKILAEENKR